MPASCEICYDAERAYTTFLSFFEQLYKNTKGSDTYRALSSLQALAVRTSNRWLRELTFSPPLRPLTQGGDGGRGWGTSWRRRGDPQIQTRDSPPIIYFIIHDKYFDNLIQLNYKIQHASLHHLNYFRPTRLFRFKLHKPTIEYLILYGFNACLTLDIPLLFHACSLCSYIDGYYFPITSQYMSHAAPTCLVRNP